MFRKRTKKTYPPGTFIPMPARIAAILQLCIAFSLLLWQASQPFMGELFTIKSKMAIYEYILQQRALLNELPPTKQGQIHADYAQLQHRLQKPFSVKLKQSIQRLWGLPPFELAWLFLSILLPILLLKRVEGSVQAIWLLPLLAAAYAVDNRMYGIPSHTTAEEQLFPTEETLIAEYLHEPLSKNIFHQQEQLKKSWERYLIARWSDDAQTLDRGTYAFQLARLEALKEEMREYTQKNLYVLALYLFWNLSLALIAQKAEKRQEGH